MTGIEWYRLILDSAELVFFVFMMIGIKAIVKQRRDK